MTNTCTINPYMLLECCFSMLIVFNKELLKKLNTVQIQTKILRHYAIKDKLKEVYSNMSILNSILQMTK